MRVVRVVALAGGVLLFSGLVPVVLGGGAARIAWAGEERYATHGIVKSFGPKRAYVNIAHERIPGYMEAMTMSFEPRSEQQLTGVDVGARVAFAFTVTPDGRRLLDQIAKE